MSEFSMPCDTFHRLSKVIADIPSDFHPSWRTLRVENGCLIATDKSFMAIENFSSTQHGPFHIIADPALIAQCEMESKYNGRITFVVNEMLKFAVAKTTFGFSTTTNILYAGDVDPAWPRWKELALACKEPASKINGPMFMALDGIGRLIASSPSGLVVFEEMIDINRPTIIRDVKDAFWLGVFAPNSRQESYAAATVPAWLV